MIHLKDRVYPFYVTLNFRAFNNLDIIETWTEYSHNEKKAVVLKRFDSGHFMIRRGDVWISSLSGHWGTETRITTEPLTSGMKVIKIWMEYVTDWVNTQRLCFHWMVNLRK